MLLIGQRVTDWVAERVQGDFGRKTVGIGWLRPSGIVAGVVYEDWNGANVVCHIAGEGANWLNREYLWTIFDYPFNQLRAKRITVYVSQGNEKSLKFVKHLGFRLEAKLEDASPTGCLHVFRMRRDECRWIKMKRMQLYGQRSLHSRTA